MVTSANAEWWSVVSSRQSDLRQLDKRLAKQEQRASQQLRQLQQQKFACEADARQAAQRLAANWPLHQLAELRVESQAHHSQAGRPAQGQLPTHDSYRVSTLTTNELDIAHLDASDGTYKDHRPQSVAFAFSKTRSFVPAASSSTRLHGSPPWPWH
ncbi:MAG: hypothetical protein AAF892_02065 [Cyanobacteria bacterium P01_D01_bin.71]